MKKSLNEQLENLPPFLGREIFQFLLPQSSEIYFCVPPRHNGNYSKKYETAYYEKSYKKVVNNKGYNLSRIVKKNGKIRYYATSRYAEEEHSCDEFQCAMYYYEYESYFIGKDWDTAMLKFITF
jgi:hypothetical protein